MTKKKKKEKEKEKEKEKNIVKPEETFKVDIIDSSELKFQNLSNNGFVVSILQNDKELWIDLDLWKKRIVFKIPGKNGHPVTHEFTVSQLISMLSSRKAKKVEFEL